MSTYKWLRQNYEAKLCEQLRDAIDYGEMTEDEADPEFDQLIGELKADLEFDRLIEEWEAGYGDYVYDTRGDR